MTAETAAPKARRLHLDFIDGMRGIASLYVVLHHIWGFAISDPEGRSPRWFGAFSVLSYGDYGVTVFIVVSGFCLMLPVMRGSDRGTIGSRGWLREFARRRSRRILPAYFVALAGSMLLIAGVPALRSASGTPWDMTLPSFTAAKFGAHLLLIHNWFEDLRWAFNPPLWSVALEYQIYFVFALLILPIWRRWNLSAAVLTAFALAMVPLVLGAGHARPQMLAMFALGVAAASVSVSSDLVAWREKVPWRAVTVMLVLSVIVVTTSAHRLFSLDPARVGPIFVGLATMAAMISMSIDRLGNRPITAPHRLLASPMLRWLGAFSFSLYLVHFPLIALVSLWWTDRYQLAVPATFAVLVAVCVPLSLACAYVFHRAVERRFINPPTPATGDSAPGVVRPGALALVPRTGSTPQVLTGLR